MNKLILLSAWVTSIAAYSQIGINTHIPEATLDIRAQNVSGSAKNVDGLLIPRVDRERAKNMLQVETSTLIYVNDIKTGLAIDQASNIDETGFYYFEKTKGKWVKLIPQGVVSSQTPFKAMTGLSSGTFNMSANNGQEGVNFFEFNISNGNLVMPSAVAYKDRTISVRNSASTAFGFTFQETYVTNQIAASLLTTRSILFHSDGTRWYQIAAF